ncbi:MAG: fatty acid desaturase, partial [Candidatus Dormiibacterota bacterium]
MTSTLPTLRAPVAPASPPSDYAVLKRRVQDAGLLDKQSGFYTRSIVVKMALLAASLAGFVVLRGQPWALVLDAVVLAIIFGQLGFQLHDAGHRQMFEEGRANVFVGLLTGNLLLGISYGWWVDKHNRHHANPNDVDMDPDIGPGVISYSEEQALESRGLRRFIAKHQAALFFPLLFGLAWAMHLNGVTFLRQRPSERRRLEIGLLALHVVLYVGFFAVVLGPWWALVVIVVHQCFAGFY